MAPLEADRSGLRRFRESSGVTTRVPRLVSRLLRPLLTPAPRSETSRSLQSRMRPGQRCRPPVISPAAFDARPSDIRAALLTEMAFAKPGSLGQCSSPHIRFLFIGPRLCSPLPSDDASRRRPCGSLTFTSVRLVEDFHLPLLDMHGVPGGAGLRPALLRVTRSVQIARSRSRTLRRGRPPAGPPSRHREACSNKHLSRSPTREPACLRRRRARPTDSRRALATSPTGSARCSEPSLEAPPRLA